MLGRRSHASTPGGGDGVSERLSVNSGGNIGVARLGVGSLARSVVGYHGADVGTRIAVMVYRDMDGQHGCCGISGRIARFDGVIEDIAIADGVIGLVARHVDNAHGGGCVANVGCGGGDVGAEAKANTFVVGWPYAGGLWR